MNDFNKPWPHQQHFSQVNLRRLPAEERGAILEAQAALAAGLYRRDPQWTDFEAFGEEVLHSDDLFSE
jgi:hypothetical protein